MNNLQNYILNSDFSVESFDNEILLYSIRDSKGIYLNETAYIVLELCMKNQHVEKIIMLLEKTFPQQKAEIRGDVIKTIMSLIENGVLIKTHE